MEFRNLSVCIFMLMCLCSACWGVAVTLPEVDYGTGSWPEERGNQRAIVNVSSSASAVKVRIPWRRRDSDCADKAIWVYDATTGSRITNVVVVNVNREYGDIIFEPATVPGSYEIYYLPYIPPTDNFCTNVNYYPPENTADLSWISSNHLSQPLANGIWDALPYASVTMMQSRTDFNRVDPMEVICTFAELQSLLAAHPSDSYMLFPEDRIYPIRMSEDLPVRWIKKEPSNLFEGTAQPNECYAFQIGVYAARSAITNLSLHFGNLTNAFGDAIPASAFNCINMGGTDWLGEHFTKNFEVGLGRVRPLWINVQMPENASGIYEGDIVVSPAGNISKTVHVKLTVEGNALADKGDSETWRHSRLRWLDSTLGISDDVIAPYTPIQVNGSTLSILNREVTFAGNGLPTSIKSCNREILSRPITWNINTADGNVPWTVVSSSVTKDTAGTYEKTYTFVGGSFTNVCKVKTEFDGCVSYELDLSSSSIVYVNDVNLKVPFVKDVAKYMMGFSKEGGFRPTSYSWKWDINRCDNMVWLGDYNAGLQCKLVAENDNWESFSLSDSGLPVSWNNSGKGGAEIIENGSEVVLNCYSGSRYIAPGSSLKFKFRFLVTPFKPIDSNHWNWRYGINIDHIHHATNENPYINYPFLRTDLLKSTIDSIHALGKRMTLYYTVRELSNHATELWALRSLDEIYSTSAHFSYSAGGAYMGEPGTGYPWLREHLIYNYSPAWFQKLSDTDACAAIGTTGLSRWHNYYVEGLRWLMQNVGVDGLYLDGIGYNRDIMKRVRRVMLNADPNSLIKFHSGNNYSYLDHRVSPMNQYMEHLPYISDLWIGEMYDYSKSPDYWFVEVSGIPFGLTSEMLNYDNGGNPYRGMVYGMTGRYHPSYSAMTQFWDSFGIQSAKMIGYWDPSCPVHTGRSDVLATVYKKSGKVLISLASWAASTVNVNLNVDWASLKINPNLCKITTPSINGFQSAGTLSSLNNMPIEADKGCIIVIESVVNTDENIAPGDSRIIYYDNFNTNDYLTRYRTDYSPSWTYTKSDSGNGLTLNNTAWMSCFQTKAYLNGRFTNKSYTLSARCKYTSNAGPYFALTLLNNGYLGLVNGSPCYSGYVVTPYNLSGGLAWFVDRVGLDKSSTNLLNMISSPVSGIQMNSWFTAKATVDVRKDETLIKLRWDGLAADGTPYTDERVVHDASPARITSGTGISMRGYRGDDGLNFILDDLMAYEVFYGIDRAKIAPDGVKTWLTGVCVSSVFDDCFYVETADRLHAIRINSPGYGLERGDEVVVTGYMTTNTNGERAINPDGVEYTGGSSDLRPFAMLNKTLGGSGDHYNSITDAGQRGIDNGIGINNIGMLIRTTGIVKNILDGAITISDGSADELMVYLPTGMTVPVKGSYVVLTGISSIYVNESGAYKRLLRVASESDVQVLR